MKLLVDTQLLIWSASSTKLVPKAAAKLFNEPENLLYFSAASIWEIVIKSGTKKVNFNVNARLLRRGLLDNGYFEVPITGEHTLEVEHLPFWHKDPFDRILLAQAICEGMILVTTDEILSKYSGPVKYVPAAR